MGARLRSIAADHPESVALICELDAELNVVTPKEHMFGLHPGEAADPRLRFFIIEAEDAIVGCGALRELEPGIVELKRMFVRPAFRGRGYGRDLLEQVEREAIAAGIDRIRLETSADLPVAVGLYRSFGFVEIPKYGEYVNSPYSLCMEKRLTPPR
ncbi:MAG TPA: GNAT family N-acetyltransferase [Gemmatimonadaceae bacterium]